MNQSFENFHSHLEELLVRDRTYAELSKKLGFPESTLKSWFNRTRAPGLKTLDQLADYLGCYTYELIRKGPFECGRRIRNDSHRRLCYHLNTLFIDRHCFSLPQKLTLLQNQVTDSALISYLRSTNYKMPTLKKLDLIADTLNLETYELLKEAEG